VSLSLVLNATLNPSTSDAVEDVVVVVSVLDVPEPLEPELVFVLKKSSSEQPQHSEAKAMQRAEEIVRVFIINHFL
jgi:hypothetical protein